MNQLQQADQVITGLEAAGFEAYIVGGAVRDLLLGKAPSDVDVATNALPEQVKAIFPKTADTGIEHGTVLVLLEGTGIEVTTFRTEGTYSDSRRPDAVEFVTSLREDLQRRDFTINAMAMTKERTIIDPFGGQADLQNRIIRAVGDPDERFQEDALRMLRAVRFTGQLGFALDRETAASLDRNASRIQAIAVERIKTELDKLFRSAHARTGLSFLKNSSLPANIPAGGLFRIDWSAFPENSSSLTGWCYLLHWNGSRFESIRAYRFSKQERQLIEQSLKAAALGGWDSWTYYEFPAEALETAAVLTGRAADIAGEKAKLPIRSKSDMAVTGRELMAWTGKKRGPWLREWLGKIERQVVFGQLANTEEEIKDWFIHEYHNHT